MFWRKIRKVSRISNIKKICSLFLCILLVCLISAQYFTSINQNKAQAASNKIVKYIPLYFGESSTEGGFEALETTTSTTYVIPSRSNIISWDASKYDGTVAVYFEAVIMTNNASYAATAALTLAGGTTAITGSEVPTSATSFTRVRSGDISGNLAGTPTNYECIFNVASGGTATICNARLVVMQSGTITKTETYIPFGWGADTFTQATYASPRGTSFEALSLYTAANWSNVSNIYFETNLNTSNASYTAYACLHTAAGVAVTNGELTTTSTSKTRLRTAALTLTDGTEYKEWTKISAGTGTVNGGVIIIQQSGAITATETHMSTSGSVYDATNPPGSLRDALYLYTASDWSVASMYVYGEGTMAVDPGGYTGQMYSMNGGTAATTDAEAGTTPVRHRSASWTPTDGNLLDQRVECATLGAHTHFAGGKIIFVVNLAATPKFVKYIPVHMSVANSQQGYEFLDTTTSTSYVEPTQSIIIGWDASKYDGTVTVYFEAVLQTSSASYNAYASLVPSGSHTAVTGSEVYTTSTNRTTVRSGEISGNLSTADYECNIKADSGGTATIVAARLVVIQSGTITKTETYLPFGNMTGGGHDTLSTTYACPYRADARFDGLNLYTAANWSNISKVYFETNQMIDNGSYTASSALYTAAGSYVTGSELTTQSTTRVRQRSGDLSARLVDGTEYKQWTKTSDASHYAKAIGGFIIIQQSGAITATETHLPMATENVNQYQDSMGGEYQYTASEWSGFISKTIYSEATMAVWPDGYTGYMYSYSRATQKTTDTEAHTVAVRHRSASWSPTDGDIIYIQARSGTPGWGGTTSLAFSAPKIIFVVTLITSPTVQTNAATSVNGYSAYLNGNITSTGGQNCSSRGFDYRVQGAGSWTSWTEAGSYDTGAFSHALSGLYYSTTYEFRAKATNDAGTSYGSTLTFTTDAPAINFSLSGSTTDFGNLSMIAIGTSSPDITLTVSTNALNGYTVYVKDQGSGATAGLYKASTSYLIPSSTATLSAGTEGYGIQVSTSGGTVSSPYNVSGDNVGALQLTFQSLGTSTGPTSGNHTYTVKHKAAISGTTQCGSYVDIITYNVTANF